MRNKQEWFDKKMAAVPPEIISEVQLSADIIARIAALLKEKGMTQRDLARKLGRSEAVVSRWTTGFPNLTLKSIAEISTALGEPLIQVSEVRYSLPKGAAASAAGDEQFTCTEKCPGAY